MRYLITITSLIMSLSAICQEVENADSLVVDTLVTESPVIETITTDSSLVVEEVTDSVVITCAYCDTNYYYVKPINGELRAAYPERIDCYFSDSLGGVSDIKCHTIKFVKGRKQGAELKYYYTTTMVLVNPWGRRYKREPQGLRRRLFAREMRDYSLEYKGYWRKDVKHGLWYFYDKNGELIKQEEYKDGELVMPKDKTKK